VGLEEARSVPESPIRREILAQHAELRQLLHGVEDVAKRFEEAAGEDPELGAHLQERGLALYETFGRHLDREQELLTPVLRAAGAEGERLLNRLEHEHHEQRELLKFLLGRLRQYPHPTIVIARELQTFGGFLRFEMNHEEEALLSPEVLRSGDP
jgi:iron-sulfur cluster repair protein YtfE (RIC family)